MNNYWDISTRDKSGMQIPEERTLEDDLMKSLKILRKWKKMAGAKACT